MAEKKEQAAAASPAAYEALTGIDYPDGPDNLKLALAGKTAKRLHVEKGEKISAKDLPAVDIPWLLREKFIKAVK